MQLKVHASNADGLLFLIAFGVMTCCPPLSECLLKGCSTGFLVICASKERAPLAGGVPVCVCVWEGGGEGCIPLVGGVTLEVCLP